MFEKMLRVAVPAALALTLIGAGPAHADTHVYANGNCSAASTWKLNLQAEQRDHHARLQGGDGHAERGRGTCGSVMDIAPILRALKVTKDDGSFHIRLLSRDWQGFDLFRVRAVDVTTQEDCIARGVV